ncbi:EamA family transporter [Wohlfahrtiimonas chitiniclastica]|uniref:EamA family transporter n=1 Tax=Wohlfahrtiimonas chitiniclastica TaxID=400946 RepID=UPI0021577399|nr:EamA family transporter [Wohlfahrtiimonas chitiniclastica]MDC7251729.1 threonine/homoserine exporter RhtA [Wohlfahrtiimonas chitiniclastica]
MENKETFAPWAIGVFLLAVLTVQSGAVLAKKLFELVGPEGATSMRLGFAALMLLVVFRPWRINFKKGNLKQFLVYGVALGAMNFFFYRALKEIPIGIAVAIEFVGPLSVALIYSRRPIDFIWILLAVIGLLLLLPIGQEVHNVNFKGVIYALIAGFWWAVYIIYGRKVGKAYGIPIVSAGMIVGALIFAPIGIITEGANLLNPTILGLGLLVALLSSAIPFALELIAMTHIPAKTYGTLSSMEPAVGAIFGIVFLSEYLLPIQWIALSAIICASLGATLTARGK